MGLSSKEVSSDQEFNWTQNMLTSDNIQPPSNLRSTPMKRPLQTQQSEPLKCPRCDSTNTKFCYYNNYNKTQPRHFCKACKRHWTKGGTLRSVPVGGGRKNKRIKHANTTTTATTATTTTTKYHGLALSDKKYIFPHDKGLFFKPSDHHSEFDQVSWDFNGGFTDATTTTTTMQQSPHQDLGFPIHTNMSFIDATPIPIIPTSFPPILSGFKDDFMKRMMMPDSSNVSPPWLQVPATSNLLEANYWNWNDTDSLVQADLKKPFDDPQKKH